MICVNCLDITEVSQELYEKFYKKASAERRQRADQYRCWEDARRCIFAEGLLRFSLQEAYGYCPNMEICHGEHGKPFIKGMEGFQYNLSHSGKWVVIGYVVPGLDGGTGVGIDVEKIRQSGNWEKMAARFFAKDELEYVSLASDEKEKVERFTEIWTRKESYVKCLGCGLSKNLDAFSVDDATGYVQDPLGNVIKGIVVRSYPLGEDYYLSVCSNDEQVEIKNINVQELIDLVKS